MNESSNSIGLEELAGQVARGLSKAGMLDGRAFIRTSVLFPSGATVVVVIEEEGGGNYRLTDLGQGRDEADLLGIAAAYNRQAQEIARFSGLRLDGGAMTLRDVNRDQLIAGTMVVANASARALERTMLRAAPRPEEGSIDRLVTRLTTLFPKAEVVREVEVRGASTHAWPVAAMVTTESGRAVFDVVKPSPVSVVFASAKFHDFARLEDAPTRIAVVHRKAALGDLLTVVAQAARVVEDDAPDTVFTRAVAA